MSEVDAVPGRYPGIALDHDAVFVCELYECLVRDHEGLAGGRDAPEALTDPGKICTSLVVVLSEYTDRLLELHGTRFHYVLTVYSFVETILLV